MYSLIVINKISCFLRIVYVYAINIHIILFKKLHFIRNCKRRCHCKCFGPNIFELIFNKLLMLENEINQFFYTCTADTCKFKWEFVSTNARNFFIKYQSVWSINSYEFIRDIESLTNFSLELWSLITQDAARISKAWPNYYPRLTKIYVLLQVIL